MSDKEATFKINITGNASVASKDVAASARQAAKAIGEYENEVKSLSADLRRLKGNSDEITATKAALKKRIDEAKTSASALTAELLKQGSSYAAAAAAAKKYGDGVGKLPNLRRGVSKAVAAAGGAVAPLAKKASAAAAPVAKKLAAAFAPAAKIIGAKLAPAGRVIAKFGGGAAKSFVKVGKAAKEDLASVLPSIGTLLAGAASGAALAAVAIAAVGAGFIAAAAAVAAFGIAAAASAAKMQLQRQALLGNAQDAKNLGDQIGVLAGKVPQGVAELNDLSRELSKTRLSGKAIVDTLNAVAQASGAVDASAGSKIQELLTRMQHTGRFALGRFELQGTGIDFDDVAKEYAAGMHKSVEAARSELLRGQVSIDDAASTLKRVTEKKFGDINIQNAFSLENAPKKLKEQLSLLSKGVDLSPISKGLQDAFGQLAPNAPLGSAIKTFMESFGGGLVDIAGKSIPVLIEGFKWMLVWALKLGTHFYETKKKILDAFRSEDWIGAGVELVKGVWIGILKQNGILVEAMFGMAGTIKQAFKDALGIRSPSKVFKEYGERTTEGYAQGVDRGSRRSSESVDRMAGKLDPQAGGAAAGGGNHESIEVNLHGVPMNNMSAMSSPEFLGLLTRALRDSRTMRGAGV